MYVYCDKYYVCKDEGKDKDCFKKVNDSYYPIGTVHIFYDCKEIKYKEIKIKYISDFEALMIRKINES